MDHEPVTEAASFAGRTVGNYRIDGLVGAGGMGEVYRGWAKHLDRAVAIKVLPRTLSTDETARKRFVRETRMAARVVHPYVATVFDVVEDGTDVLLVMEYLEGRTLRKVVREDRPDAERVLQIGTEIAEALQAIHEAGLVHRDLKPGNVMISPNGHVKVMDFGVARVVEGAVREEEKTLTREGFQVGTVQYMSPEQVRGRTVDARSDLFALGGLLWEAITGEHPFSRGTVVETATAILNEPPGGGTEPPSLTESGALRDVVLRLLRKNPDERYPSAEVVLDDLRAVARGERPSRTDFLERVHRRRRNTVIASAFVAGAIATALIVAAVVWSPWGPGARSRTGLVADARPLAVLLPFDAPGDAGEASSRMTADLLTGLLAEGPAVRTAPMWRIEELLDSLGPDAPRSRRVERVRDALAPRFILAGTLYAEGGDWLASIDVVDGVSLASLAPVQARAPRASDLAATLAGRLAPAFGGEAHPSESVARLLPESDRALAAYTRAKRHDRRLEWVRARAALEEALEIEPGYLDAAILLPDVLRKMGYERDASAAIRRAERIVEDAGLPPSATQALELRTVAGRLGRSGGDVEAWTELVERRPGSIDDLRGLAGALGRAGRTEEALAAVERALALDPEDGTIHLERADMLRRLERDDAMREEIAAAETRFLRDDIGVGLARVRETEALVAYLDARFEDAARLYGEAADLFARYDLPARAAGCTQYRADALVMLRREPEALPLYAEATDTLERLGHYRRAVRVRNSTAALALRDGRYDEAERGLLAAVDLARSLQADDLELDSLMNLSLTYGLTARASEAVALGDEAVEIAERAGLAAERCDAEQIRGIARAEAGDLERGISDLSASANGDDCRGYTRPIGWQWIAWYRWVHQDPAAALAASVEADRASKGLYGDPDRALLLADHGRILVTCGRPDDARAAIAESLKLAGEPDDQGPEVRYAIEAARAVLAVEEGRFDELPPPDPGGDPLAGPESWIRLIRIQADVGAERWESARDRARELIDHPWTPLVAGIEARVLLARAERALGRDDVAAREAEIALRRARDLDLPLTEAWALAILDRGDGAARAARTRYLERFPHSDRARVAERRDLKQLTDLLEIEDSARGRGGSS